MSEQLPETSKASITANVLGYSLMVIGAGVALVSLPLVLFMGFGLLGLAACAGLVWAGQMLIDGKSKHALPAGIAVLLSGGLACLPATFAMLLFSCDSIVNCGSASPTEYAMYVATPSVIMAISFVSALVLWRRAWLHSRDAKPSRPIPPQP